MDRRPRGDMPQIKSTLMPEFLAYAEANGVGWAQSEVAASDLQPSQDGMVESSIVTLVGSKEQLTKPVLVSQDGYVLDGHHRWEACRRLGRSVLTRRLATDAEVSLQLMERFGQLPENKLLCAKKSA